MRRHVLDENDKDSEDSDSIIPLVNSLYIWDQLFKVSLAQRRC